MFSVREKAEVEIREGYRDAQVKSLKYYLQRINRAKRRITRENVMLAEDKKTVREIENMTVEEFSESTHYRIE